MMSIHKCAVTGLATLAGLVGVLTCTVTQADASLGEFSLAGSFKEGQIIEGIAIDESTNDVYIYDTNGIIFKFDEDGKPVIFSGLGSNEITGVGSYGSAETELAVDNSTGPAKGDIYLAGGSGVKIFGPDGKQIGELTQVGGRPWGEVACGVAVDGTGHVYVGLYNVGSAAVVSQYTPTANPVTNADYTASHGGLNEICEIAADPNGAIYASTWNPNLQSAIVKLDSIQSEGAKEVVSDAAGRLAVVNSASAELFFSHNTEIFQYDPSGNPLSTFGAIGTYRALAINAKNGRLYTYRGEIEIWQGVTKPEVRTTPASNLSAIGGATLNGTVNPEGASVESCVFEYGATSAYGSVTSCSQEVPLTGTTRLSVSAGISGVQLNHAYHYRLATTDAHGAVDGADEVFKILVRPTVEDQQPSASAITRSSVRLTGTIDPEEGDTIYHFEYGPTDSYGNSTASLPAGNSAGDMTLNQQINDLIPDTTYHYRLVAKNVAGLVEGADHTFRTGPPVPPVVVTAGASGVAQNVATINGVVNSGDLPTTYGFEVGTSVDYGPPTGLGPVGAGLKEAQVSLVLTGLLPGTTYHYRITATNIDGTTYGADQTFTTSVFASTFAEPPAPLPFVTVPTIVFPSEAKPIVKKPVKKIRKKTKKHGKAKSKKKPKSKKK